MNPTPGCHLNHLLFLSKSVDTTTRLHLQNLVEQESEAIFEQKRMKEEIERLEQRLAAIRTNAKSVSLDVQDEHLEAAEQDYATWLG